MKLYHGTDIELNPGDILNPKENWVHREEGERTTNAVFATPNIRWAEVFAFKAKIDGTKRRVSQRDDKTFLMVCDVTEPFEEIKDKRCYVYEVDETTFRPSNPDNIDFLNEHVSEEPVRIKKKVVDGTIAEFLEMGNQVYSVPTALMEKIAYDKNIKTEDLVKFGKRWGPEEKDTPTKKNNHLPLALLKDKTK